MPGRPDLHGDPAALFQPNHVPRMVQLASAAGNISCDKLCRDTLAAQHCRGKRSIIVADALLCGERLIRVRQISGNVVVYDVLGFVVIIVHIALDIFVHTAHHRRRIRCLCAYVRRQQDTCGVHTVSYPLTGPQERLEFTVQHNVRLCGKQFHVLVLCGILHHADIVLPVAALQRINDRRSVSGQIVIVFYVSIHDLAFQAFVALRPHGDIPLRHRRKVYFRPAAAYSGVRVKLGVPKCRRLVMCAVRRRHGTAFSAAPRRGRAAS